MDECKAMPTMGLIASPVPVDQEPVPEPVPAQVPAPAAAAAASGDKTLYTPSQSPPR